MRGLDRTPRYIHFKSLDEWDQDDVVVVEVFDNDTGNVRTHYPNRQSGPQPIEEAFDEAHRFITQDPNIAYIGVVLHEGAEWSPAWGVLLPDKSSLITKPFR